MKHRENYPAFYALREAVRNGKQFLPLMLLVALCVGGAAFADGLQRSAEPAVSAFPERSSPSGRRNTGRFTGRPKRQPSAERCA